MTGGQPLPWPFLGAPLFRPHALRCRAVLVQPCLAFDLWHLRVKGQERLTERDVAAKGGADLDSPW